jgi:hypothetical protein
MKRRICNPHQFGVSVDQPLAFDPNCPRCQELLAQGKRTGREPLPIANRGLMMRRHVRAFFAGQAGRR